MKRDDIYTWERLRNQFQSLHKELSTLSADKPDQAPGNFKVARVNSLLARASAFLSEQDRPFDDFMAFNEDDASYSDVVLVIGQYIECLKAFRDRHVKYRYGKWFWMIDVEDGESDDKRYIAVVDTKDLDD